jgi:hypothetical protein
MNDSIKIGDVLGLINNQNSVFSLKYRKSENGAIGIKERLRLREINTNKLGVRKIMNRSGLLKLKDLDSGRSIDLYIDLLIEFNNKPINFLI